MMVGDAYTTFYSVDTNDCSGNAYSVNKLNDGRQCEHKVLYSVDTNGCSSKA